MFGHFSAISLQIFKQKQYRKMISETDWYPRKNMGLDLERPGIICNSSQNELLDFSQLDKLIISFSTSRF